MACEKLRERICGEWAALLERSWVLKKIAQPRHHLDTFLLKLSKADTQPCSGDNSHAGNLHGPRRRQASGVHLETLAPNQHGPQDWRQRPCKGAHWHTVATLPTDRTGSILPAFILQAPHVSNPPSRHLFVWGPHCATTYTNLLWYPWRAFCLQPGRKRPSLPRTGPTGWRVLSMQTMPRLGLQRAAENYWVIVASKLLHSFPTTCALLTRLVTFAPKRPDVPEAYSKPSWYLIAD